MPIENSALVKLKGFLANGQPELWTELAKLKTAELTAADLLMLNKIMTSAQSKGILALTAPQKFKVAVIGAFTFHPFVQYLRVQSRLLGLDLELFVGEYDNYASEILSDESELVHFQPDFVVLIPSERRHRFEGSLLAPLSDQRSQVEQSAREIKDLCTAIHSKLKAEVILSNFRLPNEQHMGPLKHRGLYSEWIFRKSLNTELGLQAPSYVHVVDSEFISAHLGLANSEDSRRWYESKQLGSSEFQVRLSNEISHLILNARVASKKVVVLDLDNTLWGGVIGDDDITGIELGDTSPRGEAFKDFQKFIKQLKNRGFLLAVCSKNEEEAAKKPFLHHPEMVLKLDDIVSFKANWRSKADNIKEIATELNLGADSMIFIDDNPAEIAMVNQFMPMVSTIQLSTDPSEFLGFVNSSGLFHQKSLTSEDLEKTEQYQIENQRSGLRESVTDMGAYLNALEMSATISSFKEVDAPRISQLINKSNQFNLTTRRRSETEVASLIGDSKRPAFTVRLQDRFGDYGLIAVVVSEQTGSQLLIETLLMSCRVLERGVEHEIFNKIERIASSLGCDAIVGVYKPTSKNAMVRDLFTKFGFTKLESNETETRYVLPKESFNQIATAIKVQEIQ